LHQEAIVLKYTYEESHLCERQENIEELEEREEGQVVVIAFLSQVKQEIEEDQLAEVNQVPTHEVLITIFVDLDRLYHQQDNGWEERNVEHQVVDTIADFEAGNAHWNAIEKEVNEEDPFLEVLGSIPLRIYDLLHRFLQEERVVDLVLTLLHYDLCKVEVIKAWNLLLLPDASDLLIDDHHLIVYEVIFSFVASFDVCWLHLFPLNDVLRDFGFQIQEIGDQLCFIGLHDLLVGELEEFKGHV